MTKKVGICFSRQFEGIGPLDHIGPKRPVYIRLLKLCKKKGWGTFVLTRKTYKGKGVFEGCWKFVDGKFECVAKPVKIDLVYDRSAGVHFPPEGDESLIWVNKRDFKILAWDKWAAFQEVGECMPQTLFVEKESDLENVLSKIKTDWVVLKPFNGLKGFGVFIGPKVEALNFKFPKGYKRYIAQEFVDTSKGILGITKGMHDLRIAIVNGSPVWSHVRVPANGSFMANAAQGGTLTEVDYKKVPQAITNIVDKISKLFFEKYDNPIYSLDFGIGKNGKPYIFEINDQIGFPKWEMKQRDAFLNALVENFKQKINS